MLFDDYSSSYPYADDGKIPAPPGSGMLEPFTTLSFLAACTKTVRLATGICLLAQRNPVYSAKEVATLDWLSNGRVDFGIGVGWLEEEYDVVNVPFAKRGKRTDEYLDVMKALWTTTSGELPTATSTTCPHATWIRSRCNSLTRRCTSAARVTRRCDGSPRHGQGWYTFNRLPEQVGEGMARLEKALAAEGRSRADLTVTACPYFNPCTPEMIEQYAEAGVDQVTALFFAMSPDDVGATFDGLQPLLDRARSL